MATIFLSFSVLYILDTGIANRMFSNWIYKSFIIEETHWGVSGTFVDTQFNWLALKKFIYIASIAVVSAIVLLSCLIYYGSAKKKSRQIMNQISNAMRQVRIKLCLFCRGNTMNLKFN